MTFKAGLAIMFNWHDYRLTFLNLNLRENFVRNDKEKDVWFPQLIFTSSVNVQYIGKDQYSTFLIEKTGELVSQLSAWEISWVKIEIHSNDKLFFFFFLFLILSTHFPSGRLSCLLFWHRLAFMTGA